MNSEIHNCRNCKKGFTIVPEDFAFYEKIQVPPPTWCPGCRNMRRMAWREERALYRDACKLCGKSIVSIHAPGGPFTIYCRDCWKSDKWDPMDYGREYDFNKPFFKQYRELMEAVPRPALTGTNIVNSDYSHACVSVKNCYLAFVSLYCENSQYIYIGTFFPGTHTILLLPTTPTTYMKYFTVTAFTARASAFFPMHASTPRFFSIA